MNTRNILIGVGVLAVGYYIFNMNKKNAGGRIDTDCVEPINPKITTTVLCNDGTKLVVRRHCRSTVCRLHKGFNRYL